MHNLCVFCSFSTFALKFFKGWGCNFTWSFGKILRSKSMEMVFVTIIIRHKLCMIYAFLNFFVQKSFSYCWDKFDYLGSIVCLSCYWYFRLLQKWWIVKVIRNLSIYQEKISSCSSRSESSIESSIFQVLKVFTNFEVVGLFFCKARPICWVFMLSFHRNKTWSYLQHHRDTCLNF